MRETERQAKNLWHLCT